MNEHLKSHTDKAFMMFTKVYIYNTNTKKPWDKLTEKDKTNKKFKWYCEKWFCISKGKITSDDMKNHLKICPELKEPEGSINERHVNFTKGWVRHSKFYRMYDAYPLTEYDLKLLLNVIGIRMLHFVN